MEGMVNRRGDDVGGPIPADEGSKGLGGCAVSEADRRRGRGRGAKDGAVGGPIGGDDSVLELKMNEVDELEARADLVMKGT
jgi:hypothetical protein